MQKPETRPETQSEQLDENDFSALLKVRGSSVLLIDDNFEMRQLLERHLRFSGAAIDMAENGFEGLKKALGNNYDVILMDIEMPRLNGLEAARKLRAWGYKGSVVALTAHSERAEREQCLAAGFDDYMTKPIDRLRLLCAIALRPRTFEVGAGHSRPVH